MEGRGKEGRKEEDEGRMDGGKEGRSEGNMEEGRRVGVKGI